MSLRVATWNINGLRARLDFVLLWLRERQPDVVGLQELKLSDEQFPHLAFQAEGYHAVVHGQKSWNGVAVLSRQPATLVQSGLPGQEAAGARLITADVDGLRFTTVYCPNGKTVAHDDYALKLAWFESLAEHLASADTAQRSTILCGDFNVCPAPLDSWNEARFKGSIFHTDAERERFSRLLSLGYSDIYRSAHPDTQAFSWWDYRGGAFHRKQGLRIDFLLGTSAAMSRVRSVEIDRDYRKKKNSLIPSDHAPVIAELE